MAGDRPLRLLLLDVEELCGRGAVVINDALEQYDLDATTAAALERVADDLEKLAARAEQANGQRAGGPAPLSPPSPVVDLTVVRTGREGA